MKIEIKKENNEKEKNSEETIFKYIDKEIEKKVYGYLKRKKINRKTIAKIMKYAKKYNEIKINFTEKILKNVDNYNSENFRNEFIYLRIKAEIFDGLGVRKLMKNSSYGYKRLKELNKINFVRDSLKFSYDYKDLLINDGFDLYRKIIGLNMNKRNVKKIKELLKYYIWHLKVNYTKPMEQNDPTPNKG